jgi:O-acetyl-ADP-ribose deacetylase (regulator of RNase III)
MNVSGFQVKTGDMFHDHADLRVCPVNCQPGVMGAGLAKRFAQEYPTLPGRHRKAVLDGELRIGQSFLTHAYRVVDGKPDCSRLDLILLFPTKTHWKNDSQLPWIFQGLAQLYSDLNGFGFGQEEVTLAFPALGCGLGGLPFDSIAALLRVWASGLPERFHVHLYRPR